MMEPFSTYEYLTAEFTPEEIAKVFSDKTGKKYALKSSTRWGAYDWCGKYGDYVLTMNDKRDVCSSEQNCQLIKFAVLMSPLLYEQTDKIEVYDDTGFLAHYSLGKDTMKCGMYKGRLTLKYVDTKKASTELTVKFIQKYKNTGLPPDPFMRPPMKTLVETKLKLPKTDDMIKGDRICSICTEEVVGFEHIHMTTCGHVFHSKCINEYIIAKGCTEERVEFCKHYCKHSDYVTLYSCPNCRTMV